MPYDVNCDWCGKGLMEDEVFVDKTEALVLCETCCAEANKEPD